MTHRLFWRLFRLYVRLLVLPCVYTYRIFVCACLFVCLCVFVRVFVVWNRTKHNKNGDARARRLQKRALAASQHFKGTYCQEATLTEMLGNETRKSTGGTEMPLTLVFDVREDLRVVRKQLVRKMREPQHSIAQGKLHTEKADRRGRVRFCSRFFHSWITGTHRVVRCCLRSVNDRLFVVVVLQELSFERSLLSIALRRVRVVRLENLNSFSSGQLWSRGSCSLRRL